MQNQPIPRLRTDLEVRRRRDGKVEIRDPHLFQILTVDAEDYSLAQSFDGARDAQAVHERLRTDAKRVSKVRVEHVAAEFEELKLLDTPDVWETPPIQENLAPSSQLESQTGLTVLPLGEEGAAWTCNACGACCHGLTVELSKEEEARIDGTLYRDILGDEGFAEDAFINPDEPMTRVLRQRTQDRDACIFLAPDGKCYVHARQGMEAKPNACQIFPLMVVDVPRSTPRLGLRVNCQSMYRSYESGPAVSTYAQHALRVLGNGDIHKAPSRIDFFGQRMGFKAFDAICKDIIAQLKENGLNAETLREIDAQHLEGRVRKNRRRFGREMQRYLINETEAPIPIESGAYMDQIRRLRRGWRALEAMEEGELAPDLREDVSAFLIRQFENTLYVCGPLNAPDGGLGLLALLLCLEAIMHAVGKRGDLAVANTAFDVFTHPMLETLEHMWPILDALDRRYAARLRKEMTD